MEKSDPFVTVTAVGTLYRGAGAPFPPGAQVPIPESHAAALKASGHVKDAADDVAAETAASIDDAQA